VAGWCEPSPLLVDDVGQDGELLARLDAVLAPVVGQLVARLLARHPLLYPFFAAAVLLPSLAGTVQRKRRVGHFLHALVAHIGQPELDRLSLGAGDALHDAQQRGGVGAIRQTQLAVRTGHFQLYDFLVRLLRPRLLCQLAFQIRPVAAGIAAVGQHLHHISDREPPGVATATRQFLGLVNRRKLHHLTTILLIKTPFVEGQLFQRKCRQSLLAKHGSR